MRTSFRLLDMTSFLLLCGSGQEGTERPKWQTYRLGCIGHHKMWGGGWRRCKHRGNKLGCLRLRRGLLLLLYHFVSQSSDLYVTHIPAMSVLYQIVPDCGGDLFLYPSLRCKWVLALFWSRNSKSIFDAILIPFCLSWGNIFFYFECIPTDRLTLHRATPFCSRFLRSEQHVAR